MKGTIENYKENILKEGLKRALYHSEQTRVVYDELANFRFLRQYKQYSEKLEQLHNKHKGQRCFLVATGPSINKTNLSLLDNEITVGVNTAYKLPVNYNYFVVSDRIIWDVYKDTLLSLGTTLFIGYVASRHFLSRKLRDDVYLVKGKRTTSLPQNFPSTINNHVYVYANTVVYLALQILYYLGFSEVYLLGCDCTYSVDTLIDRNLQNMAEYKQLRLRKKSSGTRYLMLTRYARMSMRTTTGRFTMQPLVENSKYLNVRR